jgi:hypothetical protein
VWASAEPLSYTNWGPGEPDHPGTERWAEISSLTGLWSSSVNDPPGPVYVVAEVAPPPPPGPYCYPDCNADHRLDVNDFICFQSLFACGCLIPDCNQDNALNVLDFICFQQRFAAGCSAL